jgi:hypothetical protein
LLQIVANLFVRILLLVAVIALDQQDTIRGLSACGLPLLLLIKVSKEAPTFLGVGGLSSLVSVASAHFDQSDFLAPLNEAAELPYGLRSHVTGIRGLSKGL